MYLFRGMLNSAKVARAAGSPCACHSAAGAHALYIFCKPTRQSHPGSRREQQPSACLSSSLSACTCMAKLLRGAVDGAVQQST